MYLTFICFYGFNKGMSVLITIIKIVGSVGLFIYGMKLLSDGLQKSAGNKLKTILKAMTSNRVMAILTGTLLTMVIQSSSATTVMVVSFVNAGLMNLVEAIGVIFGANIGTTVTSWIVALLGFKMDIVILSLGAVALSLPFLFSSSTKRRECAEILLGFGFLFLGLYYLQSSMPDISEHQNILYFLSKFNNDSLSSLLVCVVVGAIITAIVQASAATMAITITMAYNGWIGVWAACALCLGQNIGTTITALLASFSTGTNGKRTAVAHTLFNVIGSLIAIILFKPMMIFVNKITPGDIFTFTGKELTNSLPAFLAMFHSVFNIGNTIIFFPFIKPFAKLIERIVPDKSNGEDEKYHFKYLASARVDSPEVYMLAVADEIEKMGALTRDMFDEYMSICISENNNIEKTIEKLKKKESYADDMQEELINFCVKMLQDSGTPTSALQLNKMIRIIDETESITDSIYNLAKLTESKAYDNLKYTAREDEELKKYNELTSSFLALVTKNLGSAISKEEMMAAKNIEIESDRVHTVLRNKCHDNLSRPDCQVKAEMLYLEVIRNLEHISDYALNIAESAYAMNRD